MSETWEIRKLITKINRANDEIQRKKNNMRREVDQVPYWWSGNAATSFVNRYGASDADITRLCKKMDELRRNMEKLLEAIEDAEEERRAASDRIRR